MEYTKDYEIPVLVKSPYDGPGIWEESEWSQGLVRRALADLRFYCAVEMERLMFGQLGLGRQLGNANTDRSVRSIVSSQAVVVTTSLEITPSPDGEHLERCLTLQNCRVLDITSPQLRLCPKQIAEWREEALSSPPSAAICFVFPGTTHGTVTHVQTLRPGNIRPFLTWGSAPYDLSDSNRQRLFDLLVLKCL